MHPYIEFVNPHLGKLLQDIGLDKRFQRGQGPYLYDHTGQEYLDCIAAYGALPFGYNPPEIWRALHELEARQEPSFIQPSLLEAAGELAARLIALAPSGFQYVTFANSGAEAVEAAFKLVRAKTGKPVILSTRNSFHGKTLGALSATGNENYQSAFGAPVPGFRHIPYGDLEALESYLAEHAGDTAAFIVEPIQGEGGIVEPPQGYLKQVQELCARHGVRTIFDEIQTGLGRTGALFACAEEGVTPDVMVLAKALGGGLIPIGAVLCRAEVYTEDFGLKHSSTFEMCIRDRPFFLQRWAEQLAQFSQAALVQSPGEPVDLQLDPGGDPRGAGTFRGKFRLCFFLLNRFCSGFAVLGQLLQGSGSAKQLHGGIPG